MIKIESVINGYIVTNSHADEPDEVCVFESADSEVGEVESCANMLRHVKDLIGPSTSRYSDARVYVEVKPGDKNDKYCEDEQKIAEASMKLLDLYAGQELTEDHPAKQLANLLVELGYWYTIPSGKGEPCAEL